MRHNCVAKKFGRSMAHRKALMRNMVTNLVLQESIITTTPKAKQARRDAEKLVTMARKGTLASRRNIAAFLMDPDAVRKMIDVIVPAMDGRKGGYTRILKLGTRRGDAAERCVFQWVVMPSRKEPEAASKAESAPAEGTAEAQPQA